MTPFLALLPCCAIDDLNWKHVLDSLPPSGPIVWEFELGLDVPYFTIDDELCFSSLKLALLRFAKEVWPSYRERTVSAVLYRGTADFASHFLWSDGQEENLSSWRQGRPQSSESHLRRLFCADVFAHYFQMLAHALLDELPLRLHFDSRGCGTPAEIRQLLSKGRFEHFLFEEPPIPSVNFGVCFPEEERCGAPILAALDHLFETLKEPYRVVEEAFLAESWEGLDQLYVISKAMSVQGKRKLIGFCAAGGRVIVEGESLGLSNEISSEEFRGRGI